MSQMNHKIGSFCFWICGHCFDAKKDIALNGFQFGITISDLYLVGSTKNGFLVAGCFSGFFFPIKEIIKYISCHVCKSIVLSVI